MTAAELVTQLAAAGTPPELLAAVAKELFTAEHERAALADRRRNDRERQARRNNVNSRELTCDHANGVESFQDKNPPHPIKTQPSNPPLKGSPPILIPEHVLEAWNAMAERAGLSKAKLTPERRRKLTSLIPRRPIEDWTEAIAAVERSSFCRGENDRGWRADFDFLLQPKSFTRLIEGSYDRSTH